MSKKRVNKYGEGRCHACGLRVEPGAYVCPHCGARVHWSDLTPVIQVDGHDAEEVQKVTLALMREVAASRVHPTPWASGLFYLIVFLAIIATLSVVGHVLPAYVLPIVLVGGLLALAVIGAFQLRQDDRLSEENFIKLMALSFRYIPWLHKKVSFVTPSTSQEGKVEEV